MSIFVGHPVPMVCLQVGDAVAVGSIPTLSGGPGAIGERPLGNGQTVVCTNGPLVYTLMVTDAPADGTNIIATADDTTRKWVLTYAAVT